MIAQIKILTNAKEIEEAQKLYQSVAQENYQIEQKNKELSKAKRSPLTPMPSIPEQVHELTSLYLVGSKITMFFANVYNQTISMNYCDKDFVIEYDEKLLSELKMLPQFIN